MGSYSPHSRAGVELESESAVAGVENAVEGFPPPGAVAGVESAVEGFPPPGKETASTEPGFPPPGKETASTGFPPPGKETGAGQGNGSCRRREDAPVDDEPHMMVVKQGSYRPAPKAKPPTTARSTSSSEETTKVPKHDFSGLIVVYALTILSAIASLTIFVPALWVVDSPLATCLW